MAQTPRELVRNALTFNRPERLPRQTWFLPWAGIHLKSTVDEVYRRFPDDITGAPTVYRPSPRAKGDAWGVGTSIDEWGCEFINLTAGIIGEVKDPILKELDDAATLKTPDEILPDNVSAARDVVNRFCAESDRFVMAGTMPRPWERMQFLRGTENAMIDVISDETGTRRLLTKLHDFYLREYEFWASTDVDALGFMDDWGSQTQLLIPPTLWREFFKPLYRDYCSIAHSQKKFSFMHSDGCIGEVYDDLIEVGVDALNSQLFTMDMADLARRAKGKITFWGEIDRQHIMTSTDPATVRAAVRKVAEHLYDPRGGIIAQFEVGPGAHGPNALLIHEEWERIHAERRNA